MLEHRVECRPRDLSEPRNLALGQAGLERPRDQVAYRVALSLGLFSGSRSGAAVADQFGADVVAHPCIVLDNTNAA
jgi:hypothetical protein